MWDSTSDEKKSFNHKVQGLCEWGRVENAENIKKQRIVGDMGSFPTPLTREASALPYELHPQ